MFHPKDFLVFLEEAGKGCISGKIIDWPQLKSACKWAAEEINALRDELKRYKMRINKTNYKVSLNFLTHCLRTLRDIEKKTQQLLISSDSIYLVEDGRVVLRGIDNVTDYLYTTVEAHYDEP